MRRTEEGVRAASTEDLRRAAGWIDSAVSAQRWAGSRIRFPIDFETLEVDLQFERADSYGVIDREGVLVGFGQVVPKRRRRAHLARLIVDPARRGSGFGGRLARALVDIARAGGSERVSLNVDPENVAALALYRALEFKEAERPSDERPSTALYLERSI